MRFRVRRDGWLARPVRHAPSPNHDLRPAAGDISLLVLHNISLPPGEFGAGLVEPFFCNRLDTGCHPVLHGLAGVRVSAHLFIDRDGAVTQFVGFGQRAWHAGQSSFAGRANCNDFSIGIELEGTDTRPYSHAQYRVLARLLPVLMARYPAITAERIVGHEHIAPGRKTDPGPAFDWPRLRRVLRMKARKELRG